MAKKVGQNDWLDEQATDLAKEGLRTLIVAKKNLTEKEYDVFRVRGRSLMTSHTKLIKQSFFSLFHKLIKKYYDKMFKNIPKLSLSFAETM